MTNLRRRHYFLLTIREVKITISYRIPMLHTFLKFRLVLFCFPILPFHYQCSRSRWEEVMSFKWEFSDLKSHFAQALDWAPCTLCSPLFWHSEDPGHQGLEDDSKVCFCAFLYIWSYAFSLIWFWSIFLLLSFLSSMHF